MKFPFLLKKAFKASYFFIFCIILVILIFVQLLIYVGSLEAEDEPCNLPSFFLLGFENTGKIVRISYSQVQSSSAALKKSSSTVVEE